MPPLARLVAAALLLLPVAAAAQPTGTETYGAFGRVEERRTNVTSYYFHVLPGQSTTQVAVWGSVRSPGVYEVGTGTTLGELLSLAGGPVLLPRSQDVRRTITVRVLRPSQGTAGEIYRAPVEQFVQEPERHPALADGDIVEVETSEHRPFSWRDGLTAAGGVAALFVAVERMISLF